MLPLLIFKRLRVCNALKLKNPLIPKNKRSTLNHGASRQACHQPSIFVNPALLQSFFILEKEFGKRIAEKRGWH
jgi:hypothetical protein